MLTLLGRKRISEDKAANVFVNSIIDVVESGFADVAGIVNTDPAFVKCPNLSEDNSDRFLLIVISANLKYLNEYFDADQGSRLKETILEKLAKLLELRNRNCARPFRSTMSVWHG